MRKVSNVDIFEFLKYEFKMDGEINHPSFDSKHDDKFKCALIWLLTVSDLFPLEFVQKYQCCQLCVLRENSNAHICD